MMISILVLSYNNKNTTQKFIEALYQNTETDFNLFILDNGSTDGVVNYLKSLPYKNLALFLNVNNIGIIAGRNRLYELTEHVQCDYFCFLDNDQFVQPGWDSVYLSMMNDYDIIGTEAWQMRKNFLPFRRLKNKNEIFHYIGCGGMMIKPKVIEDIGLFDSQFNPVYFEDPDFCFRANQNNYKIGWCGDKIIEHQKHDLTLKGERKTFFMKNLKAFQHKWKNYTLPQLRME